MSKVVKSIGSLFGGGPDPEDAAKNAAKNASVIGGEMTPEQLAEQRAVLAAQGRRPKEEELTRQKQTGTRPLQGSGSKSSLWM